MRNVVFSGDVCSGEPRIDQTRLSCASVASLLHFRRLTLRQFFDLYPHLSPADVKNCLNYCSKRQCVKDRPINYCHGCDLDKREDDSPSRFASNFEEAVEMARSGNGYTFLGTVGEYLKSEEKHTYWEIADCLNRELFGRTSEAIT